jgi:hypothetical protein
MFKRSSLSFTPFLLVSGLTFTNATLYLGRGLRLVLRLGAYAGAAVH